MHARQPIRAVRVIAAVSAAAILGGCGGGGSGAGTSIVSPSTAIPSAYTQQLTVSGLPPYSRLTLLDQGANPLTIQSNGTVPFPTSWLANSYALSLQSRTPGLTCTVSNPSGALGAADVSVAVQCGPASETVLYSFGSNTSGDGMRPNGGLVLDASGNLFGTTFMGGAYGSGTAFQLGASGAESLLWSFNPSTTATLPGMSQPESGLVADASGNLYGTTRFGGTALGGTLFKIAKDGTKSVLVNFGSSAPGSSSGKDPFANLIVGSDGLLYGATTAASTNSTGVVFDVDPATGVAQDLYSFGLNTTGTGPDGNTPYGRLLRDSSGNLYGTNYTGGAYSYGTAFKLSPSGVYTVLHDFGAPGDGQKPHAGLIMDASGNLYGTTAFGGAYSEGTVFRIAPDGTYTVLYSFGVHTPNIDGLIPQAGLVMDADGNMFGTTSTGGTNNCGTVFRLDPSGSMSFIFSFASQQTTDGCNPAPGGRLLVDATGNLYGTTQYGGVNGNGTVFELH